jgi:hypothetical protein
VRRHDEQAQGGADRDQENIQGIEDFPQGIEAGHFRIGKNRRQRSQQSEQEEHQPKGQ